MKIVRKDSGVHCQECQKFVKEVVLIGNPCDELGRGSYLCASCLETGVALLTCPPAPPKTGVALDTKCLNHLYRNHYDTPERLEVLRSLTSHSGCVIARSRKASTNDILAVHSREHFDRISATEGKITKLSKDTTATGGSYEAAMCAAGSVLELIDMVLDSRAKNGFAFVRPAGHHAGVNSARGFCLFNNIAIGTRYAQRIRKLDWVLIVDFDLHHGNGTQEIFFDDPSVLFFSVHQRDVYPGTGDESETGGGFNANVPLDNCDDDDIERIYSTELSKHAVAFRPNIILVSAGFDGHIEESIGRFSLTANGYAHIARVLIELSKTLNCKIVFVLEGGYHLESLKASAEAVLEELVKA